MAHCCSQCDFRSQFESALTMHRQLHHDVEAVDDFPDNLETNIKDKSKSLKRDTSSIGLKPSKLSRTSSATKLFGKLRAKICRSKILFPHPEEPGDHTSIIQDISGRSECTSKAFNMEPYSRTSTITTNVKEITRETYGCHLCSFEADRITVLDRHLLNDHHIGIDKLLKLVLAKTKDGLADENPPIQFGIRQPYYKEEEFIEDGEFVIETFAPKIKILKHSSTNTDHFWCDSPDLKDNCRMLTKELDNIIKAPTRFDQNDLMQKMQTLNECMCKFVDCSNTLKKVVGKGFGSRYLAKKGHCSADPLFDLGLGDMETPREWERAHSEKLERHRSQLSGKHRNEKPNLSAESYYF